jgi:hypothetical protein
MISGAASQSTVWWQHLLHLNSITVALQKRKHPAPEAGTVSLSKRIHDEHISSHKKKSKLGTSKEERAVLSHSPQSDQKHKVTMKARQIRRAIENTIVCSHPFTVNCVISHLTSLMANLYVPYRRPLYYECELHRHTELCSVHMPEFLFQS